MTSKEKLRRKYQRFRQRLSASAYREKSRAIIVNVKQLSAMASAETIHAYWPQPDRREVDTRPLIRELLKTEKRIVLPVVDFDAYPEPELNHRQLLDVRDLETNRWGIREPTKGPIVPVDELDTVLVPALGAGRNGFRIGRGSGYYDRFLAQVDIPTIGLVYGACLDQAVPYEPHDVPLSVIVTETEILHFSHPDTASES